MSVRYATISAMRAAATSGFSTTVASTCYVDSVGDFFQFRAGDTTAPVSNAIVPSSDALGNWRRMGIPNQTFLSALFWSVDPTNSSGLASDEKAGWGATQEAADLVPLLTMQELNRRLTGLYADVPLVIHLMSSPDSTNFCVLTSLASAAGTTNYITFRGDKRAVDGTAIGRAITARVVAVPSSNTERTITIGGVDPPQYVNMMVQTVAGDKTAFVTRRISSGVYGISEPRSSDGAGGTGSVVDFAPGDTVSFYDCTRLCDYPFPPDGVAFPLLTWIRLDADGSNHYPSGQMGGGSTTWGQCIFGDTAKAGLVSHTLYSSGRNIAYSCQFTGQHANAFYGGTWDVYSPAIAVAGDGPMSAGVQWQFFGECNIVGISGAPAFRQLPGPPTNVFFQGDSDGKIAVFGSIACCFDMWQPNHAEAGSFVVRCNSSTPNAFSWYGVATASGASLRLLTLGVDTRSQLPYSTLLTVTTGGSPQICIDGADFQFRDVPIQVGGSFLSGGQGNTAGGPALNLGKQLAGGGTCVSYGDQSPASDSVALTWSVGDRRYAVGGAAGAIAYWRCSVAGTPGTWVVFP